MSHGAHAGRPVEGAALSPGAHAGGSEEGAALRIHLWVCTGLLMMDNALERMLADLRRALPRGRSHLWVRTGLLAMETTWYQQDLTARRHDLTASIYTFGTLFGVFSL